MEVWTLFLPSSLLLSFEIHRAQKQKRILFLFVPTQVLNPWHANPPNSFLFSSMGTREISKRKEKAEEFIRKPVPSQGKSDGNFKQSYLSVQEPTEREGHSSEEVHKQ